MLAVSALSCLRGERRLFSDVAFELAPGEWLHVQGENGAGKTTLLRALVGLAQPDEGEIRWRGAPIGKLGEDYRREMLYLGHHGAVKEELTPLENLRLAAALDGRKLDDRDTIATLHRFGLKGREELPVRCLSAGQKRRVLLARLVTRNAALWVLDEPFTALDVKAIEMLSALIGEHLAQGGMAILTSHQAMPMANGKVMKL
ncbi:MAG: cytochrome c biogenesis heme-transporting ATPase CcmA [Rhodocyclaceae bacterium]|jgi:heme exporter protein A|nr:cytochrome c biogenesis heme-transporting ATPase CcmA [Rhodocyclaceae bacterium]MBK6555001.1 cytochrome c biogenesis heme-transporting ATPase CcmA [Rhodocyclaceae bacterium]MBK6677049.1 cytochrome c biogenesis heme-transporting ATPase CcmA [Rhodocyclaceae bacterium]MBK7815982.1 cytochrome c biogenesis heme-transporting ATPase CcmA [Rhodocyclaceae bacterium]MBK9309719.1 cytochrome c biogenesis heme-transporting ATPase CcmA [Rhodocyclaceae bacterium]